MSCATADDLRNLLGKGRAKKGMFEGNTEEGELEIGQVSSLVKEIQPAGIIIEEMVKEYNDALDKLKKIEG